MAFVLRTPEGLVRLRWTPQDAQMVGIGPEREQRATLTQVQDAANRYLLDVSEYIGITPRSPERSTAGRSLIVSSIQLKTLASRLLRR